MTIATIPNISGGAQAHTGDPAQLLAAVFPLVPRTKLPAVEAWQFTLPGQYQITGNSYGINLPANVLVLDADPRNYPEGRDVLAELLAACPGVLPTRTVRSPSGGYHLYTSKPTDVKVRKKQLAWPGIDFLSSGCYTVGPDSETEAGVYVLEHDRPIRALPEEFLMTLQQSGEASTSGAEASLRYRQTFESECKIYDPPEKGSRDSTTIKHAGRGYDLALPEEIVYESLRDFWNCRSADPLPDSKLRENVANGYRYAKNAFGCATAEAIFTSDMAAPPVMMCPEERAKQIYRGDKQNLPSGLSARWESFIVPRKYKLSAKGVEVKVFEKDGKTEKYSERICDHLAVIAKTRGVDGDAGSGLVLEFVTLDRIVREVTIPRRRLHQDGKLLAQDLADMGFRIQPGKEQQILSYLNDCNPETELIAVSRTGWATSADNQEKLVFVFQSGATDSSYRYQPERLGSAGGAKCAGTLDDWVGNVFGPVSTSPFALYEILKALSAPLLKFAPVEGGEHLYGRTTTGKTTLIQIGASVWGSGADPGADSGNSYIHKWNTTANALEGLLAAHNDLPAYFDELGSYSGADFDKLVYNATSGAGKDSMDTSRNLKKRRTWRTSITSTGELSLINRIEETTYGRKKIAKGGQLLRIIDRAIHESTFSSAEQVDSVKRACATFYGTLGRAFVEKIINRFTELQLKNRVRELFDSAKTRIKANNPSFNAIQRRASNRFALAEVAGSLLVEFDLIPGLSLDWMRAAVDRVVSDWEPSSRQLDDGERAIQALREFLLTHRDTRFKRYGFREQLRSDGVVVSETVAIEKVYRDLAGYFDEANKRYCLYPTALQEATGLEPKEAAKELDKRALLVREKPNKLMSRISIDGERTYIYAVSTKIVSGESDDDGNGEIDFSHLI